MNVKFFCLSCLNDSRECQNLVFNLNKSSEVKYVFVYNIYPYIIDKITHLST